MVAVKSTTSRLVAIIRNTPPKNACSAASANTSSARPGVTELRRQRVGRQDGDREEDPPRDEEADLQRKMTAGGGEDDVGESGEIEP